MQFNKSIYFNGRPMRERDKKKVVVIFSLVAAILMIAAIVCLVWHYKNSSREYEIIEGVIIDFHESRSRENNSRLYAPIFTFSYYGQSYTNTHSVRSSSYGGKNSKYQIGTVVDVRVYIDEEPRKAVIADGISNNIGLIVAAVLCFMATIFFIVSRVVGKIKFEYENVDIENQL